jgi:hypothetical protein
MRAQIEVLNQPQVITIATNTTQRLYFLGDVNASNAQNGALLQYDATTQTWNATNKLDASGLTIDAGNY